MARKFTVFLSCCANILLGLIITEHRIHSYLNTSVCFGNIIILHLAVQHY